MSRKSRLRYNTHIVTSGFVSVCLALLSLPFWFVFHLWLSDGNRTHARTFQKRYKLRCSLFHTKKKEALTFFFSSCCSYSFFLRFSLFLFFSAAVVINVVVSARVFDLFSFSFLLLPGVAYCSHSSTSTQMASLRKAVSANSSNQRSGKWTRATTAKETLPLRKKKRGKRQQSTFNIKKRDRVTRQEREKKKTVVERERQRKGGVTRTRTHARRRLEAREREKKRN